MRVAPHLLLVQLEQVTADLSLASSHLLQAVEGLCFHAMQGAMQQPKGSLTRAVLASACAAAGSCGTVTGKHRQNKAIALSFLNCSSPGWHREEHSEDQVKRRMALLKMCCPESSGCCQVNPA